MSRLIRPSITASVLILMLACTFLPTPTPQVIIETIEVTREVTKVVEVAPTPKPSPSPTELPSIVFVEDFEEGPGKWHLDTSPEGSVTVAQGQLLMTVERADSYITTGHPDLDYLNKPFDLTMTVIDAGGPDDASACMTFRWTDKDNSAHFSIDGAGFVSLGMWLNGEWYDTILWATVRGVSTDTNVLRLVDSGDRAQGYVNGQMVFDVPFEQLRLGGVALQVTTFEEGGASWAFDDIVIRRVR